MELTDFAFALRRNWAVFVACLLAGLIGPAIYNHYTLLDESKSSVAVLDPLAARPAGYGEAQVTFDQIIQSYALSDELAPKMGESSETIHNNLSVTLANSLSPNNTSPIYVVHAKDKGLDRAIRLGNLAVADAKALYVRLNAANGSDVTSALSSQSDSTTSNLQKAEDAFNKFINDNNAAELPSQIAAEQSLVSTLQESVYSAQSQLDGDAGAGASPAVVARDRQIYGSLSVNLSTQQDTLAHLESLLPQYNTLSSQLQTAQAASNVLSQTTQGLVVNQIIPPDTEVKVLDKAQEEKQTLYVLLVYGLGILSGLILGLAAIYILGLVRRRPPTAEEVAEIFSAPVLVRIPTGARQ